MSELSLNIATRQDSGKEFSRKIRRTGTIPGVFYFHGKENIKFTVSVKEVEELIGHESGLISAKVDGKQEKKCVVREIQYDPIKSTPIHIDLMGISMSEKITVTVPVHLTGTSIGVKNNGGVLQHVTRELEIECLPNEIPSSIDFDVTNLEIGDSVHIKDLEAKNLKFIGDDDMVIATVSAPRTTEEATGEIPTSAEPELITRAKEEE